MKYFCSRCKIEKESEQFYVSPKGHHDCYCRNCRREIERSREGSVEREAHRKNKLKRRQIYVRELKNKPCADCLDTYPYFVMDLDHIGEKFKEISRMVTSGLNRIKTESLNCEPVCANCHRIRTFEREPYLISDMGLFLLVNHGVRKTQYGEDWRPEGVLSGKNKKCLNCQKDLPVEWFKEKGNNTEVYLPNCLPCSARYQTQWHRLHEDARKAARQERRISQSQENREYILSLKEKSVCTDCRRKWPSYVLDFDHIGEGKTEIISRMTKRRNLEAVIKEIAKCELVCANCHRYRTQTRILTIMNHEELIISNPWLEIYRTNSLGYI